MRGREKKKKINKSPFTLLEILITLILLTTVGTLVSVQTFQLVKKHRFEKEVEDFFSVLQEAQLFAVIHNTEIFLELIKKGNSIAYQLTTDEPISPNLFSQKKKSFLAVKKVIVDGKKDPEIHFRVSSQGVIEPRGVISFHSEDGEMKEWVDLRGGLLLKHTRKEPRLRPLRAPQKI